MSRRHPNPQFDDTYLAEVVAQQDRQREPRETGDGRGEPRRRIRAEITGLANDYIEVQPVLSDGSLDGTDIEAAKPTWLRHGPAGDDETLIADYFPLVTGVTTNSANEIDATDGSTTETWEVFPPLVLGGVVWVESVPYSGSNGSGEDDLKWELTGPYGWKRKAGT